MPKISLACELLDLVSKVMTLLCIVTVVLVETIIPYLVPELSRILHGVGPPQEPFFFDLEKDLHPDRAKRRRERHRVGWFRSIGLPLRRLLSRNASRETAGYAEPPLGGESPGSLNNLQYLLRVWDGAFPSGGDGAYPLRPRTGCMTFVSSPRCSSRLVGYWHSYKIDHPSSAKNARSDCLFLLGHRVLHKRPKSGEGTFNSAHSIVKLVRAKLQEKDLSSHIDDFSADTVWTMSHPAILLRHRDRKVTYPMVTV
ncbi:hypothetical protein BHM03_00002988 [Ensete ventricosum]|nr:hypothetical protein BHM03_00002988 [Ensete ventricosum]